MNRCSTSYVPAATISQHCERAKKRNITDEFFFDSFIVYGAAGFNPPQKLPLSKRVQQAMVGTEQPTAAQEILKLTLRSASSPQVHLLAAVVAPSSYIGSSSLIVHRHFSNVYDEGIVCEPAFVGFQAHSGDGFTPTVGADD